MGEAEQLDEMFFNRALERRILTSGQVAAVRNDLKRRRSTEPDLGAYEIAVERGYVDVATARTLLNAKPGETVADLRKRTASRPLMRSTRVREAKRPDAEPTNLAPEQDDRFEEVPRLVEPLPRVKTAGPRNPNEDSHLEMELPPPTNQSGDSLFEEGSNPGMAAMPVTPQPTRLPEATQSPIVVERTPSGWADESLGSTNLGFESASADLADELAPQPPSLAAGDTMVDYDESARELAAETESMPEIGKTPLPMLEDEPALPPLPSAALNDSAVRDVMRDADDGYFGQPADLTRPGFSADVLAVDKVEEITLFDSEKDIDKSDSAPPESATVTDFSRTRAAPPKSAKKPESKPPITEVKDDSDFDVGVTLAGDTVPAGRASTIYEDSDAGIGDEEITGGITNEPSTGSRTSGMSTALATGEVGRRPKKGSGIGVESNITDDQNLAGEQISASQITLAQVREKMGLGEGVKIADGSDTAMKVVKRLKSGGGTYKRYTVIREIARGGMGKVLEVEDNDLRRSVALKVLRKEMLGRRDLVERFLEEAQITGQLEHPNIVPVHEIGVDGRGNLYFTMKLVEGEELSSVIKRLKQGDANAARSYPLGRLIEIFIKLCEGVAFAHARGVIHRDLKPANIMVGRFGEVQIMDWGVSKIVGTREETAERTVASDRRDANVGATMVGAILGTPTYMSPEQARGETDTLDVQSDIFSLGVILYELLSLKLPWTGKNSEEILEQVREFNPDPPSKRTNDRVIPAELESVTMTCLDKDPKARIQSAQDLIDNLRSWQEGRTLSAVQYTMGQLLKKWFARHRRAVVIGSVMVLLLVGGIVGTAVLIRRARVEAVPQKLRDGEALLADAAAARESGQFSVASDKAVKAQSEFEAVLQVDEANGEAKEGSRFASLEQARVQAAQEQAARDRAQKEKEAERLQKLESALKEARGTRETADAALKDAVARGRVADDAIRGQYNSALQDFMAVLAIDPANAEAGEAKLSIEKWVSDYDSGRERARQFKDLDEKMLKLAADAQSARSLLAQDEKFDAAKTSVLDVIRMADLALAVPLSDAAALKLKTKAAETKADITLEYARRALSQKPPKFEVCDLMLSIAEITGQRAEQVKTLRAELTEKVNQFSNFQKLLAAAEDAIKATTWTLAVQKTSEAMAEAETSKYASPQDKERLSKMWQFAQLEEIHAKEPTARTSDQFSVILAEYVKLSHDVLKDSDYIQRADGYIANLRSRLGLALLEEARDADEKVASELLILALDYLVEKAHRAEAQSRLDEITARRALADISDRLVILPRGAFIVGSLRDSDYNTQRTVEQTKILFCDRTPVTNGEYLDFVKADGYKKPEFWDAEAVEHLSKFVDSTGQSGPKLWVKGTFDPSLMNVPVTGLCWYEARAYARFRGKRLPTPDEWEVAAGAPLASSSGSTGDYPFGTKDNAPVLGVPRLREVGTAEWDKNPLGIRDLGHNCSEWTGGAGSEGRVIVKGAETGLRADLFLRYARRAKNSSAKMLDRSAGRGFRCVQEYKPTKKTEGEKNG